MSKIEAKFVATDTTFRVEGYERIEYDLDLEKDKLEEALAEHRRICADYTDAGLGTQVYLNEGKPESEELLAGSI